MARGYAVVDGAASSLRAPVPVLRLQQGVPVSPSAGRAQGQPPETDRGACAAPASRRVVGGRNDGFLDHVGRRQAQVLGVPPEFRDGAGARRTQEVPLLGRPVGVVNGVDGHGFRVVREGFRPQPDSGGGEGHRFHAKVGRGGGGTEPFADQEAAPLSSFLGA